MCYVNPRSSAMSCRHNVRIIQNASSRATKPKVVQGALATVNNTQAPTPAVCNDDDVDDDDDDDDDDDPDVDDVFCEVGGGGELDDETGGGDCSDVLSCCEFSNDNDDDDDKEEEFAGWRTQSASSCACESGQRK